jgi:hypothetical protein
MLGSNIRPDTGYLDRVLRVFPQPLQAIPG